MEITKLPLDFLMQGAELSHLGRIAVGIHVLTRSILRLETQIAELIILEGYTKELRFLLASTKLLRELRGSLLDKTFVLSGTILSPIEAREVWRDHR